MAAEDLTVRPDGAETPQGTFVVRTGDGAIVRWMVGRLARRRRLGRAPMPRVRRLAAAFLLAVVGVLSVAAQAEVPAAPTGFAVAPGSIKAKLSWDDPPAGVLRHEVRFRAGTAAFSRWQQIPGSGSDGDNASGYILSGLTADTDYDFELRAVNDDGDGDAATAAARTLPPFTAQFNTENKYHTGGRSRSRSSSPPASKRKSCGGGCSSVTAVPS